MLSQEPATSPTPAPVLPQPPSNTRLLLQPLCCLLASGLPHHTCTLFPHVSQDRCLPVCAPDPPMPPQPSFFLTPKPSHPPTLLHPLLSLQPQL